MISGKIAIYGWALFKISRFLCTTLGELSRKIRTVFCLSTFLTLPVSRRYSFYRENTPGGGQITGRIFMFRDGWDYYGPAMLV
jgi:hypothetical protein